MHLRPSPRAVDVAILVAIAVTLGSGLAGFLSGRSSQAWVFTLHGVAGLVLVPLLWWKLRRVSRRLTDRRLWDRSTAVSALALAAAVGALATGVVWVLGGEFGLLAWNGMGVHVGLGLLLVALLLLHLPARFRRPSPADFAGRRTAVQAAVLIVGGYLAWRASQLAGAALGASGRFTGSRDAGGSGNAFPETSWVADDPAPVDPSAWQLRVGGATERELSLSYDDLRGTDSLDATLDCTSGWYAEREWSGMVVGQLLNAAAPLPSARWVRFRSITGYRWSLPIDEARRALLATGVDGERLSHGHGFPLRLVAPGRRGFQWVKWVAAVEVLDRPDYGQWAAIFTSGFNRDRQT